MSNGQIDFQDVLELVERIKALSNFSDIRLRSDGVKVELRRNGGQMGLARSRTANQHDVLDLKLKLTLYVTVISGAGIAMPAASGLLTITTLLIVPFHGARHSKTSALSRHRRLAEPRRSWTRLPLNKETGSARRFARP